MKRYQVGFKGIIICSALAVLSVIGCSPSTDTDISDILVLGTFEGQVGNNPGNGIYEELGGFASISGPGGSSIIHIELKSNLISDGNMTVITLRIKSTEPLNEVTYDLVEGTVDNQVFETGFVGLYLSPIIADGRRYYSENGTVTITERTGTGYKGVLEGDFFYYVPTGPDTYSKSPTINIEAKFFARA